MLFEHMFPMLPIPVSFESYLAVIIVTSLAVLAVIAAYFARSGISKPSTNAAIIAYTMFGIVVVVYYGLFFGAPWFLTRYFAPLAPLLIAPLLIATTTTSGLTGQWRTI